MERKKFAVILPGNSVYECSGSNEIFLALHALEENNIDYQCFSPDYNQHYVVNNVCEEDKPMECYLPEDTSAIFRDNVKFLCECDPGDFDALIIPGGLSLEEKSAVFSFRDDDLGGNASILAKLGEFKEENKPVGYMSITAFLLPVVYRTGIVLTIGNDVHTIAGFRKTGRVHKLKNVEEIEVDELSRVLISPAYMLESNIFEAKMGIDHLVKKLNDMT